MDGFVNNHNYPKGLMAKYPQICAYNSFRAKVIPTVAKNMNKFFRRKDCTVDTFPIPGFLKYMEVYETQDKKIEVLPMHVLDQISHAFCSINVYPSRVKMLPCKDNYFTLQVKFTNDGVHDSMPKTIVHLEYVFHRNQPQFYGFFGKQIGKEKSLPRYESQMDIFTGKYTSLNVIYDYDSHESWLNVKIKCGSETNITKLIKSNKIFFPDELSLVAPSNSLLEAVLYRLFPTNAHFMKFTVDAIVHNGERRFREKMIQTPMAWYHLDAQSCHHYASFIIQCLKEKCTKPILKMSINNQAIDQAIRIVSEMYPFLMEEPEVCVYDIWEKYFKEEIPAALTMVVLPDQCVRNMVRYYYKQKWKYEEVIKKFPQVRREVSKVDFVTRKEVMKKMRLSKGLSLTDTSKLRLEDVFFFNRADSVVPSEWRQYFCGQTMDMGSEMGEKIMHRKKSGISAKNVVEEINYIYVDPDIEAPKSLQKLINMLTLNKVGEKGSSCREDDDMFLDAENK